MSPSTDIGATTSRIPIPTSASPRGTSITAFGCRNFLNQNDNGNRADPRNAHHAERRLHQHQPKARADAGEPECEPAANVLRAAPPKVPFQRRGFVEACRNCNGSGHERAMRRQCVDSDACEDPHREVGSDEERHGMHAIAGVNAPRHRGRDHREHHRRHHRNGHRSADSAPNSAARCAKLCLPAGARPFANLGRREALVRHRKRTSVR